MKKPVKVLIFLNSFHQITFIGLAGNKIYDKRQGCLLDDIYVRREKMKKVLKRSVGKGEGGIAGNMNCHCAPNGEQDLSTDKYFRTFLVVG